MIDFVTHNMAPLMFAGLILFMLYGYPAAFSLAAVGLFFGFIGIELGLIQPDFLGKSYSSSNRCVAQRPVACHSVFHLDGCHP